MNVSRFVRSAVFCVAGLSSSGFASAQDIRVAFFNSDRVMKESGALKFAEAKIDNEFAKQKKELQDMSVKIKTLADKLDRDSASLSDAERLRRQRELTDLDQDFKRKQRIYNEDVNLRRNEEVDAFIEKAKKTMRLIAEQEKYDIVVQDAVYYNARVDITDKVLKALTK